MQDEQIPENKKFLNEKKDKDSAITMQLIAKTSLDSNFDAQHEQNIDNLIKLKSIHLEWLSIKKIENLEVFEDLSILYLQHNLIASIQGLSHLKNLEYLALNDNRVSKVQNLKDLKKLLGLNLSNNSIEEIVGEQLPENLQLASFKNNPVCFDIDYKEIILKRLKSLEVLDDNNITAADKFKILGIFPEKLNDYASRMKQFYTKRQVEAKIAEENKPILFNTEPVNEKEAVSQLRQKTRKYLYQNKQAFKEEQQEQIENFNERIEVSRKIRDIKKKQEEQRQYRLQQIKDSTISELTNNFK